MLYAYDDTYKAGEEADNFNYLNRESGSGYVLPNPVTDYYTFLGWKLDYANDYRDPGTNTKATENSENGRHTIGESDEAAQYADGYVYGVYTYDKDTYESIRKGTADASVVNKAKDPVTGYVLPKKDFIIPKTNNAYNRGELSQKDIYGMDGVKDGTPSSLLTTGNFHLSAYFRQNLLTILMNGGSNGKGTRPKFVANGKGTVATDSEGNTILKNVAEGDLSSSFTDASGIVWKIDGNGKITRESSSVTDLTGFTVDTGTYNGGINSAGYEKIHLVPIEGKVNLSDGNSNNGTSGMQLYIPDYHLVGPNRTRTTGAQWITNDRSKETPVTQGSDRSSYDQAKDYYPTDFANEALKKGDKTLTLYGNWEPNVYTVYYDDGGKTAANISVANYSRIAPVYASGTKNSSGYEPTTITQNTGKQEWTSSQKFTVETEGNLPTLKRNFYTFDGWYYNNGTSWKKVATYEDLISLTKKDDRDIHIVAAWIPVVYTVRYHTGKITGSYADKVKTTVTDTAATGVTYITNNPVTHKEAVAFEKTGNNGSAEWTTEQKITVEAPGDLAGYKRTYFADTKWTYGGNDVASFLNLLDYATASMPNILDVYRKDSASPTPADPKPRVYTLAANVGSLPLTWLDAGTFKAAEYNLTPDRNLTGCSKSDLYAYNDTQAQTVKTKIAGVDYAAVSASVDAANKKGYVNGKTGLGYTFTYENLYAATALPTASQGCHSFGGWKNGSDTVSDYSYYKTAIEGDPYNAKSFSVTGSWGAHAPAAANIKAETIYETCTHHGLNYSYCTICGNLLTVGTRNRLSATGQHNYVQHKHFVKDASGVIQTAATVGANAPVNANFKASGTRDTAGYEDDFVAAKFGGAGTCYTDSGTYSHNHTGGCKTDATISTGSEEISSDLGAQMLAKKGMQFVFNVPADAGVKCPNCGSGNTKYIGGSQYRCMNCHNPFTKTTGSSDRSNRMYCPKCYSEVTGSSNYYHCSNNSCSNYSRTISTPIIWVEARGGSKAAERYGKELISFLNEQAWRYIESPNFDPDIQNTIFYSSTATITCPECHKASTLDGEDSTIHRLGTKELNASGKEIAVMTKYTCDNVTSHGRCGETFGIITEGELYSYKVNSGDRKWTCGVCGTENTSSSSSYGGSPASERCKTCNNEAGSWVCRSCLTVNDESESQCTSCHTFKGSASTVNGEVSWSIYGTKCNLKSGSNTGYYITCDQRRIMMCNNDGHDFYTCIYCGDRKDKGYVPKTGHAFNNWTTDTPSCLFGTYTHRECQREVAHQRGDKGHKEYKDYVAPYNHGGITTPGTEAGNGWWHQTGKGTGDCLSGIPIYWQCSYCKGTTTTYQYKHSWHKHDDGCYEYDVTENAETPTTGNPKNYEQPASIQATLNLLRKEGYKPKTTIDGYGGPTWAYAMNTKNKNKKGKFLVSKDYLIKTLGDDAHYSYENSAHVSGKKPENLGWSDTFVNGNVDWNITVIQGFNREEGKNKVTITYYATRIGHLKESLWREWDDNDRSQGVTKMEDEQKHDYSPYYNGSRFVHRSTHKVTLTQKRSKEGLSEDCPAHDVGWNDDDIATTKKWVCTVCGEISNTKY